MTVGQQLIAIAARIDDRKIEIQRKLGGKTIEEWRRVLPPKAPRRGPRPKRLSGWLAPEFLPPVRPCALRPAPERRQRAGRKPQQIGNKPLTRYERAELAQIESDLVGLGINERMPRSFGECRPGPCPHVQCSMHLYLDVIDNPDPTKPPFIKLNFPDKEPWELAETCALRFANRVEEAASEASTEEVGKLFNLTAERMRQLEHVIVGKVKDAHARREALVGYVRR